MDQEVIVGVPVEDGLAVEDDVYLGAQYQDDEDERPRQQRKTEPASDLEDFAYIPFMEPFSEDEDDFLDTTAAQLAKGKDMQGIPWETTQWTRDLYRAKRDSDYKSYFNLDEQVAAAAPAIDAEALHVSETEEDAPFYSFYRNRRRPQSSIVHFQLRNLIAATTSHDVYLVYENRVVHWNNMARDDPDIVLNVSGIGQGSVAPGGIGAAQLCTLSVAEGLIAAGGFGGELLIRRVGSEQKFASSTRITNSDNGITNAISICRACSGAVRIVCSNNDAVVRIFDGESFKEVSNINMPWAVNCTAPSPSSTRDNLMCIVGDDPVAVVMDTRTKQPTHRLSGHYDYSFAAAWHPDGNVIATGNQDLTTRLYDLRMANKSFALLKSHIGAVRSIRFSSDGQYMAVAEPADYISIYSVEGGYKEKQSIDVFGEISGIDFTPDGQRLFVAIADVHYSSLLQFDRAAGLVGGR